MRKNPDMTDPDMMNQNIINQKLESQVEPEKEKRMKWMGPLIQEMEESGNLKTLEPLNLEHQPLELPHISIPRFSIGEINMPTSTTAYANQKEDIISNGESHTIRISGIYTLF